MLLIMFLGLVANLAFVFGDSDCGSKGVKKVNFTEGAGFWYVLYHTPNDIENNLTCVTADYAPPSGKHGVVNLTSYVSSLQAFLSVEGSVTYKGGNRFEEDFGRQGPQSIWTGKYCVLEIEYKSYVILKLFSKGSGKQLIYVGSRTKSLDDKTLEDVKKDLEKNKLKFNRLVPWKRDNCQ